MENDGYDELVYLDWDCEPLKEMPSDFWDKLGKKEVIQANLQFYRRRKCYWRDDTGIRKVSNGGFVYMRGRNVPDALMKAWESLDEAHKFWDEIAISKLVDNIYGCWPGLEKYWELFEPEFCNLKKKSAFAEEQVNSKDVSFLHYIQSGKRRDTKYIDGYKR